MTPPQPQAAVIADSDFAAVQILPPSLALQRKVGGSAARLITPMARQKAAASVELIKPEIRAEVERLIALIQVTARERKLPWRDTVWNAAHEIRGLAGTCDATNLGRAANLLCLYFNGTDSDFDGDPNLVTSITVLALQSIKLGDEGHELMPLLLTDSLKAIEVQCRREGRVFVR
ncbi:MAG: hypothetical protein MUF14_07430 [Hyphomonadaceae bacterium]|jgi:hypothetical protein|nr:hypothetical protein [Hyphomonadaceae bacterium]